MKRFRRLIQYSRDQSVTVVYVSQPVASKAYKVMHSKPVVVISIVRHFKRIVCSRPTLFNILSKERKGVAELSKQKGLKPFLQFLQNVSKHDVKNRRLLQGVTISSRVTNPAVL